MKRFFVLLLFVTALSTSVCRAQNPTISVDGEIEEMTTDLDARAYFPQYDLNDRLCALIKVTLTNTLRNPLTLEVGGLGVVAREEREDGEIWFYVPAQVKNLNFKCATYIAPPVIPVRLREGTVYRITLCPSATVETVTNVVLSSNYLKIKVNAPNSTLSLGLTEDYELFSQNLGEGEFAEYLDYGTYHIKVEHPLYETYTSTVELNASTPKQEIQLTPAHGFLEVNSSPQGATIYLEGRKVGVTPCKIEEPLAKGRVELRLELSDYYSTSISANIIGDGSIQTVTQTLRPRFAEVTLVCPDEEAEIWIDSQFKGVGSWTGRLRSTSKHLVETRRTGHRSQSTQISLRDGTTTTQTLKAPVPLYGSINIQTTPMGCSIQIDGKEVGETPYIGQILVGEHQITLSKEGYRPTKLTTFVEHNQVASVSEVLRKGGTQTKVTVSCVDKDADIYFDGQKVGTGEWESTLFEGEYLFEAHREGYKPSQKEAVIAGQRSLTISLPAPQRAYGSLSVEGTRRAMVTIYSFATDESVEYNIGQLNGHRMPIGTYEAYAHRKGYHDSPKEQFTIEENQLTRLFFDLLPDEGDDTDTTYEPKEEMKEEKEEPQKEPKEENVEAPRDFQYSQFFAEGSFDGAYIGGTAGMFFGKYFGIYGTYSYGLKSIGSEFSAGPMLRIGNIAGIETSLYVGIGYNQFVAAPKLDAGVRLGYDILKSVGGKTSLSFGVNLVDNGNNQLISFPKISVGIAWGNPKK